MAATIVHCSNTAVNLFGAVRVGAVVACTLSDGRVRRFSGSGRHLGADVHPMRHSGLRHYVYYESKAP